MQTVKLCRFRQLTVFAFRGTIKVKIQLLDSVGSAKMLTYIIKKCIQNYDAVKDPSVRTAYGKLAGILGILCNAVLFALKAAAGILSGSIAILSDAFNNLSDMGSSVVALIGVTAAARRADAEHPFGHGRYEYIASLIVSFLIMMVGFELLRGSIDKILHYERTTASLLSVAVLLFSVLVKLWMFSYNRRIGKTIQSVVIAAAAQDSLNDVYATSAVLAATVLGHWIDAPIDGIMGVCISALIMVTGYKIARDTITILLGTPPDPAMVRQLTDIVLQQEGVAGVHDLIIHDYGPGRCMASIHAEVPIDGDIVKVHEMIDATEKKIQHDLGVHIVIHMDPIAVAGERIRELREQVQKTVQTVNPSFGIHDFRMTDGEQNINLIFDLEVPFDVAPAERETAVTEIKARLKEIDDRYSAVIQIDDKFTG